MLVLAIALCAPPLIGRAAADPRRSATATIPATTSRLEVTVEVTEPAYDAFQQLLDDEARTAMNRGDYLRAWHYFGRLLSIDPHDTRAMREAGRVAAALGKLRYAVDTLATVDDLTGTAPDPELHFLRGEALLALGREDEAEREFRRVEAELATGERDRRAILWLARIAALRKDLPAALALYRPLLPAEDDGSAAYAEVVLYIVEAHVLSNDWATAETLLRAFHDERPDHPRGRELLAWVLGRRGHLKEELALHVLLTRELDADHPRRTADYARALERQHDDVNALARYREARALGVTGVDGTIERLRLKLAPEVGGGVTLRSDPSGDISGWQAGGTMPIGPWLRLAATASQDRARGGVVATEVTSTAATGYLVLGGDRGELAALGVTAAASDHPTDRGTDVGGTAIMRSSPERRVQLQLRGDVNLPWRESSSTIRENGSYHALEAQLAVNVGARATLVLAGQARRLGLATLGEMDTGVAPPHADQLLGAAGLDVTLTSTPAHAARGQMFDRDLLLPRGLAEAVVLSFRHYELTSDDPFGDRLVLVERSGLDEVSGVFRRTFDRRGRLAGELRGGVGYDRGRDLQTWRTGASLMLSLTRWSRFTFDADVANESRTGLEGRRHSGSAVLHVDL